MSRSATLLYVSLSYISLRYVTLHFTKLHCNALYCISPNYTASLNTNDLISPSFRIAEQSKCFAVHIELAHTSLEYLMYDENRYGEIIQHARVGRVSVCVYSLMAVAPPNQQTCGKHTKSSLRAVTRNDQGSLNGPNGLDSLDWLDQAGLCWAGLDWAEMGWTGLDWAGLGCPTN